MQIIFILIISQQYLLIVFALHEYTYLSEYNFINWESDGDINDSSAPAANKFFNIIIPDS